MVANFNSKHQDQSQKTNINTKTKSRTDAKVMVWSEKLPTSILKHNSKKVEWEAIIFSSNFNRNQTFFDIFKLQSYQDKLEKILFNINHQPPYLAITNRVKKIALEVKNNSEQELRATIVSTDPKILAIADQITGFSIEIQVLPSDVISNQNGEYYKHFEWVGIAYLTGVLAGSGDSRILDRRTYSQSIFQDNFETKHRTNYEPNFQFDNFDDGHNFENTYENDSQNVVSKKLTKKPQVNFEEGIQNQSVNPFCTQSSYGTKNDNGQHKTDKLGLSSKVNPANFSAKLNQKSKGLEELQIETNAGDEFEILRADRELEDDYNQKVKVSKNQLKNSASNQNLELNENKLNPYNSNLAENIYIDKSTEVNIEPEKDCFIRFNQNMQSLFQNSAVSKILQKQDQNKTNEVFKELKNHFEPDSKVNPILSVDKNDLLIIDLKNPLQSHRLGSLAGFEKEFFAENQIFEKAKTELLDRFNQKEAENFDLVESNQNLSLNQHYKTNSQTNLKTHSEVSFGQNFLLENGLLTEDKPDLFLPFSAQPPLDNQKSGYWDV
jgi:hypothetical protein